MQTVRSVYEYTPNLAVDPAIKQKFLSDLDRVTKIPHHIHRQRHIVFFEVRGECDRASIELCDVFIWCKHSRLYDDELRVIGNMPSAAIMTHLTNCIATAKAMTNADECKRLMFVQGANSVQLHVWRRERSDTPILIAIAVGTPNRCAGCGFQPEPSSVKLKSCSRCYHNTRGLRVLYCSKACQLQDYPRHINACMYDWSAEEWRDDEQPKAHSPRSVLSES
jgi:hypothetical protein